MSTMIRGGGGSPTKLKLNRAGSAGVKNAARWGRDEPDSPDDDFDGGRNKSMSAISIRPGGRRAKPVRHEEKAVPKTERRAKRIPASQEDINEARFNGIFVCKGGFNSGFDILAKTRGQPLRVTISGDDIPGGTDDSDHFYVRLGDESTKLPGKVDRGNTEEGTCVPCEPNCASCQERPDHCTACDHHLVLYGNKCLAACPDKTYETDDYRCAPCHSSCETCIGPAAKECVTCRSGYYELSGICYAACPATYYPDKKRRECRPCPSGCATCNSGGCLTCLPEYSLNRKNACIKAGTANCKPGEYWSGSACERCHTTCELCDGPAADSCLTCPGDKLLEASSCVAACSEGFYQDQGRTCTPCLHTCSQCVSRINCTVCQPPLLLQSGQCRATCARGYYSDLGTCSKCYLSCMTCAGPRRDQCVTCPRGWQLAGGECHPECPQGFFMSDFGCQKCHHYCRTCKGEGPLQCTSCPPHFMLDGGLCMECLGSQYYDPPTQLCKPCHASCRSCSGPGPFSCLSCTYPLHLDKLNTQCVPCCSKYATQDCCMCDTDTGECHNASPAGKRRISQPAPPDNLMPALGPYPYGEPTAAPLQGILITPAALSIATGLAVVLLLLVVVLVLVRSRPGGRRYSQYEKVPVYTSSAPSDDGDNESQTLFTNT
ncbi:hypothetical protein M8J76_010586 [Diaphorina citri]|nr:hypothetical protein M8J76_010586 [Diaphorina citri]